MAPRANWKGFLKIAEVTVPVALYTAASTSERIAFHTINRAPAIGFDGSSSTARPASRSRRTIRSRATRSARATMWSRAGGDRRGRSRRATRRSPSRPSSSCADIDELYFDKPYYLAPSDRRRRRKPLSLCATACGKRRSPRSRRPCSVRRVRNVLIRRHDEGLIATTLNFDYEVRSAEEAFSTKSPTKRSRARCWISPSTSSTPSAASSTPPQFDDRYEAALADLVKAQARRQARSKRASAPDEHQGGRPDGGAARERRRGTAKGKAPAKTKRTARSRRQAKAKHAAARRKAS